MGEQNKDGDESMSKAAPKEILNNFLGICLKISFS